LLSLTDIISVLEVLKEYKTHSKNYNTVGCPSWERVKSGGRGKQMRSRIISIHLRSQHYRFDLQLYLSGNEFYFHIQQELVVTTELSTLENRHQGWGVAQVVEGLPNKHKALSSNPITTKRKTRTLFIS
jgi:hypothetical protein